MSMSQKSFSLLFLFISLFSTPLFARDLHLIKVKSPSLYPEGLTFDAKYQQFIVATLQGNTFISVTDAGVAETLTLTSSQQQQQLPANSTILGLVVDNRHHRILAAVNSLSSPYLASFNLHRSSLSLEFLSPLNQGIANGVTVDPHGNAYVTNSDKNVIHKVTKEGVVSILSNSSLFSQFPIITPSKYSDCGLNGVVYVPTKEYLLVVQSNTGKLFKVDAVDGTARNVILPEDLPLADGMTVSDDGVVVVVSMESAWFLRSEDSWARGVIIDKITLDKEGFATSVTVGGGGRVYVVYGYVQEVINGISEERELFRIEEIRSKREKEGEEESMMWIFLLVGLGLGYFLIWKFQMGQLVKNMDRKRA